MGRKPLNRLCLDIGWDHHAKLVQAWLAWPECRIKLHFVPAYCSHLDSIERLWRGGVLHKHNAHNRCHETFAEIKHAIPTFQYDEVARNRMSIAIIYPATSVPTILSGFGFWREQGKRLLLDNSIRIH